MVISVSMYDHASVNQATRLTVAAAIGKTVAVTLSIAVAFASGCAQHPKTTSIESDAGGAKALPVYDTTAPKPVAARDRLERKVQERGMGLQAVDAHMDKRTPLPPFDRQPLPDLPRDQPISEGVGLLDDRDPFPDPIPLPEKEVTIGVGIAGSTYRTREPQEVLSAVQPFIDLVQREVNIRGAAHLHEGADSLYYTLLDGQSQMAVSHVFEYLLVRDWCATAPDRGTVLLATAKPAHPRTTEVDQGLEGTPGTSIELVVAAGSDYREPANLRGARLALPAKVVPAPGAFLTRMLSDLGQPPGVSFFSSVTLRRYSKDAVIDVLKGKADVACVDQGTVGALCRFYGIKDRIRTVAVSPRYNVDVLFTTLNNLETRREEIELTQRQLTTLGKDAEGQEVLFFFDVEGWSNYREGDIDIPRAHYADYLKFIEETPVDLLPLLDPKAPVDRRTYDRFGDE